MFFATSLKKAARLAKFGKQKSGRNARNRSVPRVVWLTPNDSAPKPKRRQTKLANVKRMLSRA